MENGDALRRIQWDDVISSFAISQDGSLVAVADLTGSIFVLNVDKCHVRRLFGVPNAVCGLMHFTPDNEILVCGYLRFMIEDLGCNQYGWVPVGGREPTFIPCNIPKDLFDPVSVNLLNEVNSASTREVVEEVVFSFEGDAVYSISSDQESAGEVPVTVFRMSSQELLVKKTFTCPSLTLVPMKEGVVLCMKHKVPELWNFQLSECIRSLPNVKDAEKLTRMSHELIACQTSCRRLTPEELSDFGHPSEEDDYLELDDSIELDDFDDSLDLDDSSVVDDSSDVDISLDFSGISLLDFGYLTMMMEAAAFGMLVVDILNVSSGECVSSVKTRVCDYDNTPLVVLCNSQNQLLVCTSEEIDDNLFDIEKLTFSLRNNNSHEHVWERSTKLYDKPFAPQFLFSPKEESVVTWASLSSGFGLHIIDAKTGETRYAMLKDRDDIVDCKFVVNGESLVCCSGDNFLRLFNVKSGDLLSVLDIGERPCSLGACLGSSLVAIGLSGARLKFIHVEVPRVEDAEEKKG
ncbi:hypothetical protein OS493_037482 [Desmophyllum pertusum]|uniref:Uncharacterized protein n=1 Tax=Desmophyllum pertusum TaxID=174260 RepID=A0A9W9Z6Y7_9CNID|nr:hypothetical protein OS493_037482 [Desmophyllum pertusum]